MIGVHQKHENDAFSAEIEAAARALCESMEIDPDELNIRGVKFWRVWAHSALVCVEAAQRAIAKMEKH